MSDFSENTSILTSSCSEKLNQTCRDYLENVKGIWTVIYGPNDANLDKRLETLKNNLEEFWKVQIEELQKSKKSLMDSIESLGKQALYLEKVLGIESKIGNIEDLPLADLEYKLWELLESYNILKEERLKEFSVLKEKESNLCSDLEQDCQLNDIVRTTEELAAPKGSSPHKKVPTNEDMEKAFERVHYLESLMKKLKSDFNAAKEELCQLLDECEVLPLNKAERFACSQVSDVEFPCTTSNYHKLIEQVKKYNSVKDEALLKSNHLRDQLTKLWRKMLKSDRELEEFLDLHRGFKRSTINKLAQKMNELTTERKENLKELILQQRSLLDELWTECKYTDGQRNEFQAYHSNCFTENVLEEHEQEVEQLKLHLHKHKRIYQLAGKYFELWQRLLHLEDLAKQSDRLFKNRGGQLLAEERERKTVQKKLPAIRGDLVQLLHQHKEQEGYDFLYLGVPLLETLNEMEEERQASKENDKLQRNPRTEVASQRKRQLSPVNCTFAIPRTPRTPAAPTTPANGTHWAGL